MNLQQCRYVEAVAQAGSFSQAAKELFVTESSIMKLATLLYSKKLFRYL